MNGSAKQIVWAIEIKTQMLKDIEGQREIFIVGCPVDADKAEFAKAMDIFDKAVAYVNRQQDCRWFIDNRFLSMTRKKILEFSRL